ncbi:hypothetical protein YC2023_055515 [Brassica napus]
MDEMSLIPLFYILKKNLSDLSLSLSRLSLSLTTLLFLQRRTINEIQSTPATTRRTLSSSSISRRMTRKTKRSVQIPANLPPLSSLAKTRSYHLKSKGFILGTQGFEISLILLLSRSGTILDIPVLPSVF